MIIQEHIPKRKPHKPNYKQRMLKASWEDLLRKYDVKPQKSNTAKRTSLVSNLSYRGRDADIRSVDTGVGVAAKKESPQYTGDAMIGIGQLHKSNAIPIFQSEDAIEISKMRRG